MLIEPKKRGFTLIEIMVAVSIFAIVAVISIGALLMANKINQKAQTTKRVTDNLNFALDSMMLKMRKGGAFYCFSSSETIFMQNYFDGQDCPGGGLAMAFRSSDLSNPGSETQYIYKLENNVLSVWKSGDTAFTPITADFINVSSLKFYVFNSAGGSLAPKARAVVVVSGSSSLGGLTTNFAVQTSVSQR